MSIIPGPSCLNCEEKKRAPYPIIINERSGYICNECYNANIWANKDNQRSHDFVKFIIAYKVIQYQKRYNLTPRAAWLEFSGL